LRRRRACIGQRPRVGAAGADAARILWSRHFWDNQIPALAAAGYFVVAPNQRGYAAGARPDPADFDNYRVDRLIGDALDIVKEAGHRVRQFHLVGHDWGGSLPWIIADRWPERIASLAMLSRPHPTSFARAMKDDPEQPHRSLHHHELLDADAGPRLLAENGKWVRDRLARNGVPQLAIHKHLSVIGNQSAMEAALAWYRARGERQPIGPTKVPTLLIWGEADVRSAGWPPKAPPSSSRRIVASPLSPAWGTMRRIRCRRV